MIVVIADDFTGAAEIGGIGLRYGLNVVIEFNVIKDVKADLLVIASDTRSMQQQDAYKEVFRITNELKNISYDLLYKKIDSVLRGHVFHEIKAIMKSTGKKKVLLAPANPSFGRKIINGIYFINENRLDESSFSEDPEYTVKSSNVLELLHPDSDPDVYLLNKKCPQSIKGIGIAETKSIGDLKYWAQCIDNEIIPIGGAGFFKEILNLKYKPVDLSPHVRTGKDFLFVCGSTFSNGRIVSKNFDQKGITVYKLPNTVFYNKDNDRGIIYECANEIIEIFKFSNKIVIEINQPVVRSLQFAKSLRERIANIVSFVVKEIEIDELLVDGGATAKAIADKLNIVRLIPIYEHSPGVIRMKVHGYPNLFLTTKPGSYPWPVGFMS